MSSVDLSETMPNVYTISQVVFKALIVLNTMIRAGATDNVLGYLSNSDVLRLRNVSAGSWEGVHSELPLLCLLIGVACF